MSSIWDPVWMDPFAEDIDGELRRYERACELDDEDASDDTEEEVESWPPKSPSSDAER